MATASRREHPAMNDARQLALEFEHRPALGGDDFLVAPPNADAVAWLDRWPDWPGSALVIAGPPGCGKSHLGHVFMAESGALAIDAPDPRAADIDAPALVLDEADVVAGDAAGEEALFHLYNRIREAGRCLLMTAAAPPARWGLILPDLASRLKAVATASIATPDEALIQAVLVKLFADRQLRVDADVIGYVVARMERSFAATRTLVEALDSTALARRRNITVPLARDVLDELAARE